MVHAVRRPEHRHPVPATVQPVVAKIVKQQRQQHAGNAVPKSRVREQRHRGIHRAVNANGQQFAEHAAQLAQHTQADAVDGVVQAVSVAPGAKSLAPQAPGKFQSDQQQKHGRGQHDHLKWRHALIVTQATRLFLG